MAISFNPISNPDNFINQYWTHTKSGEGYEFIVLTGIVVIDQKGESTDHWKREQVNLSIPIPNIPSNKGLKLRNWAPFVTINAIYNKKVSHDSGHAVDDFRIVNPTQVQAQFITVQSDIAIRDSDAWLYRIAYHVTLVGEFITLPPSDLI